MALVQRVFRLLLADTHAVLDQLEKPEDMLRQSIREMRSAIHDSENRYRVLEQQGEALRLRSARKHSRLAALDHQLGLCLAEGQTDLARRVMRNKLSIEACRRQLDTASEAVHESRDELGRLLNEQRQILDALRLEADACLLSVGFGSGTARDAATGPVGTVEISETDVDIALLSERRGRGVS